MRDLRFAEATLVMLCGLERSFDITGAIDLFVEIELALSRLICSLE